MKNTIIALLSLIIYLANSSSSAAQCHPDRHSTSWFESWLSCQPQTNPNPDRPVSHWIMYSFDQALTLRESHFWNYNVKNKTDHGIRTMAIDYSLDGIHWQFWGNFSFAQEATGLSTYAGENGPDLGGIQAQYLLFTSLDNFGGSCAGFSEFRINVDEKPSTTRDVANANDCLTIDITPNPMTSDGQILIQNLCTNSIDITISEASGRLIQQWTTNDQSITYSPKTLLTGTYVIEVRSNQQKISKQFVLVSK